MNKLKLTLEDGREFEIGDVVEWKNEDGYTAEHELTVEVEG